MPEEYFNATTRDDKDMIILFLTEMSQHLPINDCKKSAFPINYLNNLKIS